MASACHAISRCSCDFTNSKHRFRVPPFAPPTSQPPPHHSPSRENESNEAHFAKPPPIHRCVGVEVLQKKKNRVFYDESQSVSQHPPRGGGLAKCHQSCLSRGTVSASELVPALGSDFVIASLFKKPQLDNFVRQLNSCSFLSCGKDELTTYSPA